MKLNELIVEVTSEKEQFIVELILHHYNIKHYNQADFNKLDYNKFDKAFILCSSHTYSYEYARGLNNFSYLSFNSFIRDQENVINRLLY